LLALFARHPIDLLTVHGRTVADMYRTEVRYDFIRAAVERMPAARLHRNRRDGPEWRWMRFQAWKSGAHYVPEVEAERAEGGLA
jgi:hypothetical protein